MGPRACRLLRILAWRSAHKGLELGLVQIGVSQLSSFTGKGHWKIKLEVEKGKAVIVLISKSCTSKYFKILPTSLGRM